MPDRMKRMFEKSCDSATVTVWTVPSAARPARIIPWYASVAAACWLSLSGMLANRRLARHIADAGFAELRRQLTYKTGWNGGRLIVAGRWYPSSKTCSGCGAVKAKLALAERTYTCATCGLVLDRDLNAARNLAALARERAFRGA
ncbi:zinc ribbon domain-containing protein [Micromonospora sp. NPDC048830]|uniref:zinc ribbon domain-containing protein n=1 Tax=Micromonospora sp. NPDC048830 TaxID=3364257 RepID=UPI0037235BE9